MIRRMLASEAEAVGALFARTIESSRWSAESLSHGEERGLRVWVAAKAEEVTGAVVVRSIADEAEILELAVGELWRRRGTGRALMEAALGEARSLGARRVFLEVRESNVAAKALYRELGFAEQGKRQEYYNDPREDAVLLWRAL
jgi:ribosomal-protein-alanine acetyltransferase